MILSVSSGLSMQSDNALDIRHGSGNYGHYHMYKCYNLLMLLKGKGQSNLIFTTPKWQMSMVSLAQSLMN